MIYTPLTIKAMKLAYAAHQGQTDHAGVPYIFHPYHVAEQMNDEYSCCAALLHDVIEDTSVSLISLALAFPAEVVRAVELLTHEEDVSYEDYIRQIKTNPIAVKVKLADLEHNYTDNKYGWTSVKTARIIARRDGYEIEMPKRMPLDN